jgi:hypothetical protein
MTNIDAGLLEHEIINRTGLTGPVVVLMGRSGTLWHDLIRSISANVRDKKILEQIELSEHILEDIMYKDTRPAKYKALKRISVFFDLLADTFKAIEDSIEKQAG